MLGNVFKNTKVNKLAISLKELGHQYWTEIYKLIIMIVQYISAIIEIDTEEGT